MMHKATRVSITAEKLIQDGITGIIEAEGASGYSIFEGGGKGQHQPHARQRTPIVDEFAIVKIEVIVADRSIAEAIAEKVAHTFFAEYSGIVYLDNVEILRPAKFKIDR